MVDFKVVSPYEPGGDQPQAIKELVAGLNAGTKEQVLLGATGTGKTFTVANVIQEVNKPTFCQTLYTKVEIHIFSPLFEKFLRVIQQSICIPCPKL